MTNGINGAAQGQLRSVIARVERLEAEKAVITGDIGEVYAEAKGNGFDVKILRKIVTLRKKTKAQRDEESELLDLYLAVIEGMGGDGPAAPEADDDPEPDLFSGQPAEPPPSATEPQPEEDSPEMARAKGQHAGRDSVPITANPYPAGTANRSVWDEAWCRETGTDGMDLPASLKRTPKDPRDADSAAGQPENPDGQ